MQPIITDVVLMQHWKAKLGWVVCRFYVWMLSLANRWIMKSLAFLMLLIGVSIAFPVSILAEDRGTYASFSSWVAKKDWLTCEIDVHDWRVTCAPTQAEDLHHRLARSRHSSGSDSDEVGAPFFEKLCWIFPDLHTYPSFPVTASEISHDWDSWR